MFIWNFNVQYYIWNSELSGDKQNKYPTFYWRGDIREILVICWRACSQLLRARVRSRTQVCLTSIPVAFPQHHATCCFLVCVSLLCAAGSEMCLVIEEQQKVTTLVWRCPQEIFRPVRFLLLSLRILWMSERNKHIFTDWSLCVVSKIQGLMLRGLLQA